MFKKAKKPITVRKALYGLSTGRIQSAGYMQVIPLCGDLSDDRFISPDDPAVRVSTTGYGCLTFENAGDAIVLVPCHAGYVVPRQAQDHAMSQSGLVDKGASSSFDTAMCIQQTQPGLIPAGKYRMLILPFALRETALGLRSEKNHGKLWEAIRAFNWTLGIQGRSNLEYFLSQFRRELDQFVAEFECVPRQMGAIIQIDDQIAGIERAPSHAYWRSVWPALIRECYGSLAIQTARARGENAPPPASRRPLPEDLGSLEELGAAVARLAAEEDEKARDIVRQLLDQPLVLEADEDAAGLRIGTLSAGRFTGQIIRDGDRVVYASLLSTRQWLDAERWQRAGPFDI